MRDSKKECPYFRFLFSCFRKAHNFRVCPISILNVRSVHYLEGINLNNF